MEPPLPKETDRIEKVQRTAARWACRCWRNQSRWRNARGAPIARTPGTETAILTFFYKRHNNLVTTDKNRYLSETGGNRSTRSHPFQYHRTGWNFLSSPRQLQLGMDLQTKLSLRRQLIGLSQEYNDLGLGRDMAWNACPWGQLVNSFNWGGFVKDLYCYLFLVFFFFF